MTQRGVYTSAINSPRGDGLPYEEDVDLRSYVKVSQTARMLGLTEGTVYELIRLRRLPAVRTPVGILISRKAVESEEARRARIRAERDTWKQASEE